MEYRTLGASGLTVPALSFGAGTFGGSGPLFSHWGTSDDAEARRLVDICLEAGVTLFDTADVYSDGASERVLGAALKGRRHQALISTKTGLPMGDGPAEAGTSRARLIQSVDAALSRLGTDYIDLLQLHAFDAATPVAETLSTLDDLVRAGKLRYIGVSNFAGWQLMKSLDLSERHGWSRYVAHQVYYSLVGRDYEWELMPLSVDQGLGTMVWSPLGWGRLTGKIRRGVKPSEGRIAAGGDVGGPPVEDEFLYRVVDALDEVAAETGRSVPQVALNWLLQRPGVVNLVIGARNETQLRQNLGAVGWSLSPEQVAKLDAASQRTPIYPYWHQKGFDERNPKPTKW